MIGGQLSITVSRLFRCRRERVFNAFAHADLLAQWFSPNKDIAVQILALTFEPDGDFRIRFDLPDGSHDIVGGRFQQISPPERLAYSWVWEAPHPFFGIETQVVIQFIDRDDQTEVVVTHSQLSSEESCSRHTEGWAGTLERLYEWL